MRLSRQPSQIPTIDWTNPITRSLVFAAFPVGSTMIDLFYKAKGNLGGVIGGAQPPTAGVSASGRNLLFNGGGGSNSWVNFGSNSATSDLALTGGTWFFWCKPTGPGGLAERNDGNSVNAGWEIGIGSNSQLVFLKEFSSTNFSQRSTSTVPLNQFCSLAVTYDGVGTNSGVGFYINGVADTPVAVVNGSGVSGSDLQRSLFLGSNSFPGAGTGNLAASCFAGNIEFAVFFKRILSPSEIQSLHRNRYQVLARPTFRSYSDLSFNGVIQSGGRPQIFVCT